MRRSWCLAPGFLLSSPIMHRLNPLSSTLHHAGRLAGPSSTRRLATTTTMTLGSASQITRKMFEALNAQGNRELQASLMYASYGFWFQHNELKGSENWCITHSEEEKVHAYKIFNHLADRDIVDDKEEIEKGAEVDNGPFKWETKAHVKLQVDGTYDPEFSDPVAIWISALEQEKTNSQHYFRLVNQAREEGDFVTEQFLMDFYIPEQLEEEKAVQEILKNAKLVTRRGPELYYELDKAMPRKPH